jgi:anti-sigma-K factor RskA
MAAPEFDHDRLSESVGLYALGALQEADRSEFVAHLQVCARCRDELTGLRRIVRALPYASPQIRPSSELRERVLAVAGPAVSAQPAPPKQDRQFTPFVAWVTAGVLLAASLGLGVYALSAQQRTAALEAQLRDALGRLDQSQRQLVVSGQQLDASSRALAAATLRVAVLTATDLRPVDLAGQAPAPNASGRAFWSPSQGLIFAASNMPQLPAGRIYQLWYLTGDAPVSAGLFGPDAVGRVTITFDPTTRPIEPTGMAVSIEPEGGVPAPTGAIYLAGTWQAAVRQG